MGKPIRNTFLTQGNVIGHRFFAIEPRGNIFFLQPASFEIPKWRFIIKPPACWGTGVSIEIYDSLLLCSIISPWLKTVFLKIAEKHLFLYKKFQARSCFWISCEFKQISRVGQTNFLETYLNTVKESDFFHFD